VLAKLEKAVGLLLVGAEEGRHLPDGLLREVASLKNSHTDVANMALIAHGALVHLWQITPSAVRSPSAGICIVVLPFAHIALTAVRLGNLNALVPKSSPVVATLP
jgi:hypothetical protein